MAVSVERDLDATRRALEAWLARRVGVDAVEVGELSMPGLTGFSNETILFDATWDAGDGPATRGLVVRVEPTGHQVFPSTEFEQQVRVLRALRAEGTVPVPEVLWFEEDHGILGDRFAVMERVGGSVPADTPSYHAEGWVPALPDAARRTVWVNGIEAMAAIHQLDISDPRFSWLMPRDPTEQLRLDRAYQDFAIGDHRLDCVEQALDLLEATIPPPDQSPAICWGDSRIGNIIFGADLSVAAVLDWEMLTAGDPVQDLAWYLLVDRHHHEAFGVERLSGLPDRSESIALWEAATGRSAEHLDWYELLGGVRFALLLSRVMQLLDQTGTMPGVAAMAHDHTGTQLLERMLAERS